MIRADIMIQNGHVIDPARGIDRVETIAVKNRRVIAYEKGMEADTYVDATDCIVTPGLIDYHAHLFELGTDSGIDPDTAMLPQGVTFAVDVGCAGVSTYRSLLERFAACRCKTRMYLHVSPGGQNTHQYHEPYWPETWSMDKFIQAIDCGGDRILGFKARFSKEQVHEDGWKVFYETMKLGEYFNKPVVAHITNPFAPMQEIVTHLRPGDIFCHVFHGTGYTSLQENGEIYPEILEQQKRGVIMDGCHGKANFSLEVARKMIDQGFRPDIISTDLTTKTWCKAPVYGLPHVMSKFLHFGMTMPEIIRCVTENPARHMGLLDQVGTLEPGSCGDITVLKVKDESVLFTDTAGEFRTGKQRIVPLMTVLDGALVYRSPELWQ